MEGFTNFGFGRPQMLPSIRTWSSSFFVEIGEYIVSFAGDDGNCGKNGDKSIRHYLMITKNDEEITEALGFRTYANDFTDFLKAIDIIKNKINESQK